VRALTKKRKSVRGSRQRTGAVWKISAESVATISQVTLELRSKIMNASMNNESSSLAGEAIAHALRARARRSEEGRSTSHTLRAILRRAKAVREKLDSVQALDGK